MGRVHLAAFSEMWGSQRGELVPRTRQEQRSFSAPAAVEAGRGCVLKDGTGSRFWHLNTTAATAIIGTFDFSHISSPKTCIIFWLFLLLIDLPLSPGCQEMPQTMEFIRVHCAPVSHHSALPSSVPDICSCPAAKNWARREFQSLLCPQCHSPVREAFTPSRVCHLHLNTGSGWSVLSCLWLKMSMGPNSQQMLPRHWVWWEIPLSQKRDLFGEDVDTFL